jgi:hypothetical protein
MVLARVAGVPPDFDRLPWSHDMADVASLIPRLRAQMTRGDIVLFLGSGFSTEAVDIAGRPLPTSPQLTRELWDLAFPGEAFDTTTRLADAYYAAKGRSEAELRQFLMARLSVNAERLPDFYATWFSMPWHRCYTLNFDDVEVAASRRFRLPRPIRSSSATSGKVSGSKDPGAMEVVHLNGAAWDEMHEMTFSDVDYGSRLTTPSAAYAKCSVDLVSRPVLVVGTELQESLLWQYLEYRRARGPRDLRELRPGSYLVCPALSRAREYFLRELNIDWVKMTAEEFARVVLRDLGSAVDEGHAAIRVKYELEHRRSTPRLVSEFVAEARSSRGEYFLGHEPTWDDLTSGRAVERECDRGFLLIARRIMSGAMAAAPLVLIGTAGSGKSSSLMRIGLHLSAEGLPVHWIDETTSIDPHGLRTLITTSKGPVAILVDDADLWGRMLSGWARELPSLRPEVLFACALRSTKIEGLLDVDSLGGIAVHEAAMPPLTDQDIEALIAVLDANNRLGILKGKSHSERVDAFRKESEAGRQLLVAMIKATSGVELKDKVFEEFKELSERQRLLYGITCFVHAQRFSLQRDELLLAAGVADNETLNAIEALVQRHLVVRSDLHGGYRARHRVVAEELVAATEFRAFASTIVDGICFAFANKVTPGMPRTARPWRRLIRFINHAYLLRIMSIDAGLAIYTRLEGLLNWDYHYWLQRGSLEVEAGDLERATHFLDTARSLSPDNRMIETEYGYLQMKKAIRNPRASDAQRLFDEGFSLLEDLIASDAKDSPYPYHVIGSQGLGWARHRGLTMIDKRTLLQRLRDIINEGLQHFPLSRDLKRLADDLEREWLSTAVRPDPSAL